MFSFYIFVMVLDILCSRCVKSKLSDHLKAAMETNVGGPWCKEITSLTIAIDDLSIHFGQGLRTMYISDVIIYE